MNKFGGILLAVALLLTGCTSTPEPESTTPVISNATACKEFEKLTFGLGEIIVGWSKTDSTEESVQELATFRAAFDEVALSSEGDVKIRLTKLVTDLPNKMHMLYIDAEKYFDDVLSVQRACSAGGNEISPATWG